MRFLAALAPPTRRGAGSQSSPRCRDSVQSDSKQIMIPQPPPGQGPIDPRGAFNPPSPLPPQPGHPSQGMPYPPAAYPPPGYPPMPYPPMGMPPMAPMGYPPPSPRRSGGIGRAIFMSMLFL